MLWFFKFSCFLTQKLIEAAKNQRNSRKKELKKDFIRFSLKYCLKTLNNFFFRNLIISSAYIDISR